MSVDYTTTDRLTPEDLTRLHRVLDLRQSAKKEYLMREEYMSLLLEHLALKYDCQDREIKLETGELLRDLPDEPGDAS